VGSGSRFDPLGEFIGNHPEPTREPLAVVLYERAQLLAGPLERVEEAIACRSHGELRHALLSLSADPEDMKADPLSETKAFPTGFATTIQRVHCSPPSFKPGYPRSVADKKSNSGGEADVTRA